MRPAHTSWFRSHGLDIVLHKSSAVPGFAESKWLMSLASVLCGAVSVLAFAPFGLWPVLPVALALFFILLFHTRTGFSAFCFGYLFGIGFFGCGTYWVFHSMHLFGGASGVLAGFGTLVFVMIWSVIPAGFCVVAHRLIGRDFFWFVFIAPSLWLLSEWIRSWFLSGFPWLTIGYSSLHSPLAGFAPVGGAFLNSLLIALCSGLIAWSVHSRRVIAVVTSVVVMLLLSGAGYALKSIEWTQPLDRSVDVTMVQGNIEQELKFQPDLIEDSLGLYASLSETGAELVIWPETAVPALYSDVADWEREFSAKMAAAGTTVMSGGFTSNDDYSKFYNSIKVLDGTEEQLYVKRHLVPFGEYIPLRSIMSVFSEYIVLPLSDISPGTGPVHPIAVNGVNYGMSICYEDVFGNEMRGQFPEANVLVNISNDGWFGDSSAPHQHQEMAAMRSLEFGRPMLRATNTGISSLIDHLGNVVSQSPQFEAAAIDVTVIPREGVTPFVRFGDSLVLVISVLMLFLGYLGSRRKRDPAERPESNIR